MGMGGFWGNGDLSGRVGRLERRMDNAEKAELARLAAGIIMAIAAIYMAINFDDEEIRFKAFNLLMAAATVFLGISVVQANQSGAQNSYQPTKRLG